MMAFTAPGLLTYFLSAAALALGFLPACTSERPIQLVLLHNNGWGAKCLDGR